MPTKPTTLLTLIAFVALVTPSFSGEPAAPTGLLSKGARLTTQEKAGYKVLAEQSAPDLRRAGLGAESTGHYVVIGVFAAIAITFGVVAATKKDNPPAPTAPPPPVGA
jgi:hypothetical protein